MAIYFAEKLDEKAEQEERERQRQATVEIDLAWRFATGRNMFGKGMRPSAHWRSSAAPYQLPTTLGFRVSNIPKASRSAITTTISRLVRSIFRSR
jgi:hypothetical protein